MLNSMIFRSTLSKNNFLWRVKCSKCNLLKRTLFHESVLKITNYRGDKKVLEERLGLRQREDFISFCAEGVKDRKPVFTSDLKTLILLANNKELIDLTFETIKLYREQQKKEAFQSHFNYGQMVLQMLYVNKEIDTAFKWFYNEEKAAVVSEGRNMPCFLLMLDMLYKSGRFEDIEMLASTFDEYFPIPHWELDVTYAGALYHKGTNDALYQLQALLTKRTMTETPMCQRVLMFSAMTAYKQKEYRLMLETLEMPVFQRVINKVSGKGINLKLLAYIELGRLEEAVADLKYVLVKMDRTYPIIFPCVLQKMLAKVSESGNIELKASFNDIYLALKRGRFVKSDNIEKHLNNLIGDKEVRQTLTIQRRKGSYIRGFTDNKMFQPHR